MLSYILQKNRADFNPCEDSLTSVVFDRLKYLPTEIFWRILTNSLTHPHLPKETGELLEFIFWDKWSAEETKNKRFVEPDIFIRFSNFDVIIEAKRYDSYQQSQTQRENEILSYYNEFKSDNKKLFFIMVGGLQHLNVEEKYTLDELTVEIYKTNWTRLLDGVVSERKRISIISYSILKPFILVLDDIIKGFELHQFYQMNWLSDLMQNHITSSTFKHFMYASTSKNKSKRKVINKTNDAVNIKWLNEFKSPKVFNNKFYFFNYAKRF